MKEFIDYVFLEDDDYSTTPVKILTGKYKDVIVCYEKVSMDAVDPQQQVKLNFTYRLINPSDPIIQNILKQDQEFINVLGEILATTIIDGTDYNENREDNFEESDDKQRIRQSGSSIYKD